MITANIQPTSSNNCEPVSVFINSITFLCFCRYVIPMRMSYMSQCKRQLLLQQVEKLVNILVYDAYTIIVVILLCPLMILLLHFIRKNRKSPTPKKINRNITRINPIYGPSLELFKLWCWRNSSFAVLLPSCWKHYLSKMEKANLQARSCIADFSIIIAHNA